MSRSPTPLLPIVWLLLSWPLSLAAGEPVTIDVLYLQQQLPAKPVLSNLRPKPADSGLAGARQGLADNNTSSRFTGWFYQLTPITSSDPDELLAASEQWLAAGNQYIVADLPTATLKALMQRLTKANQALVFNAGNSDDSLRRDDCRAYLLHTAPSRAMLADGLAQFLISKRWNQWLLVVGLQPEDQLFAAALERSAQRFGGKWVDRRQWQTQSDLRRSAQKEIPRLTQARDYDVILVADEPGDIGEYLPYNSWLPRPVAGTQGLTPTAWHWSIEQWGAAQLQSRFQQLAGRDMNATDYSAWLAMRALQEAVVRSHSQAREAVYHYLLSEQFNLSAFKGQGLSFRPWNGQLRQPIPLVQPNAVVSQSPQEGYLHPVSTLDTLGFDKSEVHCHMNQPVAAG
ncbi:ABC transporter substrate-binding protein [Halioxenophilus sp. WMMB6]|uniref:ABC transporter substrate-binding protein n=1 Tax=Halioxenophilus sp. WMMB6 TaxID=3073815 RepID=UPI00295E5F5B|nr:ABC transporter substrate-binding protein [Halioxenophilus sp. WMMB6]